jgi:hypothetical protein
LFAGRARLALAIVTINLGATCARIYWPKATFDQ